MKLASEALAILTIIFGIFLVADDFFLHTIIFNYDKLGIRWIDPYIDHWMWGAVFLLLGCISLIEMTKN